MRSARERKARLRRTQQLARAGNAAALVTGFVLVALRGSAHSFLSESAISPWLASAIDITASALISAGVIGLVLGWATRRETAEEITGQINATMQEVLTPFREAIYGDSLSSYRWDCHISPAPPGDAFPEFAYQSLRLSYELQDVPNQLRAVCFASANDLCLGRITGDDRYLFRWLLDERLDPGDPGAFLFGELTINGESLGPPRVVPVTESGVKGVELRWAGSRFAHRAEPARVEFQVRTRKYVGADTRVTFRVNLFKTVTDAEFRFSVDPNLKVDEIVVHTGEVSRFGAARSDTAGHTFADGQANRAALAVFRTPLQKGSAVAFTLERELP